MNRFDGSRKGRIAVWTGAALAWGTVLTAAGQDNAGVGAAVVATPEPNTLAEEMALHAPLPTPPSQGLVIIRFQPPKEQTPEVQTVYVRQKSTTKQNPPAPGAAPSAAAPAPSSGGS